MINQDAICFEDIRILSEALNYFRTKDFDNAMNSIKRVSSKCDEFKVDDYSFL